MSERLITDVLELLPHRYPFLMIDRILELDPGKKIVALKNVTFNEPHFTGHYPGYPVMPGVLMIEALAQAGGILASAQLTKEELKKATMLFGGVDKVRFKREVIPGDTLILSGEIIKRRGGFWWFKGEATVNNELACSAILQGFIRIEK
jgi:3-hydroxyacyl-[acyl-carrier-protein] dehydratase